MIRCIENPLTAARAIISLERRAQEAGMRLSLETDFRKFVETRDAARPGEKVSAMFDPDCTHDLSEGRAIWLHGVDPDGRTLTMQAARMDWIDSNLASWVMPWMSSLYKMRGDVVEPASYRSMHNSIAEKMKDNVVYHGEFWLDQDYRGRKGGNLLGVLPRLCLLLVYVRWNPDYVWGLVDDDFAARGGAIRMGYTAQQPSGLMWQHEPQGASKNETMSCCENRDLAFLADFEGDNINDWSTRSFSQEPRLVTAVQSDSVVTRDPAAQHSEQAAKSP